MRKKEMSRRGFLGLAGLLAAFSGSAIEGCALWRARISEVPATKPLDELFEEPENEEQEEHDVKKDVYKIVVSLEDTKLYVLKNNIVEKQFDVAVGKPSMQTQTGYFEISDIIKDPAWFFPESRNDYESMIKKYPKGFIPGRDPRNPIQGYWIELRSMDNPEIDIDFGLHGTNRLDSIGKHISRGCVRIKNDDISYIVENVPRGSMVIIRDIYVFEYSSYGMVPNTGKENSQTLNINP